MFDHLYNIIIEDWMLQGGFPPRYGRKTVNGAVHKLVRKSWTCWKV